MPDEPTTTEILDAINSFAGHVDEQFSEVKEDIRIIKATMVTKDYLDDKLADLRGDLTVLIRKEDTKVKTLVELLIERGILQKEDRKRLFSMEPFAELSF